MLRWRIAFALALAVASTAVMATGNRLPRAVTDADFFAHGDSPAAKIELGKKLYWDKILSGNLNISCASCHHALTGTGDGLALPIGEGGVGLGIARSNGTDGDEIEERVPRNAPPVYNLGAEYFTNMFHDGRVFVDPSHPSGFVTPAGADLPAGIENILSAQAMFPVTSAAEMAGGASESPQGAAAALGILAGPGGVWEILADKLRAIPEYVDLFKAAYPDQVDNAFDITYVQAANAMGAYEATAFRADNSRFDRFLRGERRSLSPAARRGMHLFYGKAGCSDCHSGVFQTDLDFHAIAMPQIGPGKGDGFGGHDDFGRERVTGDPVDRYRFRTPSLRNVALTGPYGHAGAYDTLRAAVEHHLDPLAGLFSYDPSQAVLPDVGVAGAHDFDVMSDPSSLSAIAAANELEAVKLHDRQVDDLMAFLHALTDEHSLDSRSKVPWRGVPSGLPLAD